MENWKKTLLRAESNTDKIAGKFGLPAEKLREVNVIFPCRIPQAWLEKFTSPDDPLFRQCVPDPAELIADEALMIDPLGEARFRITYCPGEHMSREEIEGVGFNYGDLEEMMEKYDVKNLKDGFNTVNGEEVFYISNPALGLWALRDKFYSK